jgi:hypothetical protein
MTNRYRATVVASYPVETDVPRLIAGVSRDPSPDTSALDWTVETSVMIPPLRRTRKVDYEAEARDETETKATLERLVPFEGAGLG